MKVKWRDDEKLSKLSELFEVKRFYVNLISDFQPYVVVFKVDFYSRYFKKIAKIHESILNAQINVKLSSTL